MTLVVFARVSVRSSPHPCGIVRGAPQPYGTVTCGAQAGDRRGLLRANEDVREEGHGGRGDDHLHTLTLDFSGDDQKVFKPIECCDGFKN